MMEDGLNCFNSTEFEWPAPAELAYADNFKRGFLKPSSALPVSQMFISSA